MPCSGASSAGSFCGNVTYSAKNDSAAVLPLRSSVLTAMSPPPSQPSAGDKSFCCW